MMTHGRADRQTNKMAFTTTSSNIVRRALKPLEKFVVVAHDGQ